VYKQDPVEDHYPQSTPYTYKVRGANAAEVETKSGTFTTSSRSYKSQYGWRGPRSSDSFGTEHADGFGGRSWGKATGHIVEADRLERATTPHPLVRTPSLPVHDRDYVTLEVAIADYAGGWVHHANPIYSHVGTEQKFMLGLRYPTPGNFVPGAMSSSLELELRKELDSKLRATRPTIPAVGLTRAILELKDFPQLVESVRRLSQKKWDGVGSHYLGYQFGIAPLVSDVRKSAEAIINFDRHLEQFLRDSGRLVRRSVKTVNRSSNSGSNPVLAFGPAQPGIKTRVTESYQDVVETTTASAFCLWEYFAGDPTGALASHHSALAKADYVLGTKLDAATVWALAPWTWMIDWYVQIGSLLAYQQDVADHSLAMRRSGFVTTRERLVTAGANFQISFGDGVPQPKVPLAAVSRGVRYKRRKAPSPYSLIKTWDELDSFQVSILAALGLQKKGW